jgi:ABC-type histidine transport system ATPase subunit
MNRERVTFVAFAIEAKGLEKSFGGCRALAGIGLDVRAAVIILDVIAGSGSGRLKCVRAS